jgi:hypothetical protein
MTPDEFRSTALSFSGVEEKEHMGHPDFRVRGKIFATLGYPDARFGTIMVSPDVQQLLVRGHPKVFWPASGAWGRSGSTSVLLPRAPRRAVRDALEAAWKRRASKQPIAKAPSRTVSRSARPVKRRPRAV